MKPISGATNNNRKSPSTSSKVACVAALFVAFLFVVSLGGSSNEDEHLRSGQAHQHTTATSDVYDSSSKTTSTSSSSSSSGWRGWGSNSNAADVEEEVEEDVAAAEEGFSEEVSAILAEYQPQLHTKQNYALTELEDQLKQFVGDLYSAEELPMLMGRIEAALKEKVDKTLLEETQSLLADTNEQMELEADYEEEDAMAEQEGDVEDIEADLEDEADELESSEWHESDGSQHCKECD